MDSTLVGVVIGGFLGGGGQMLRDALGSKRDRRLWIDDHRRVAYAEILASLKEVRAVLENLNAEKKPIDPAEFVAVVNRWLEAKTAADFYASHEVGRKLVPFHSKFFADAFAAACGDPEKFATFMGERYGMRVLALDRAMRRELGIID